MPYDDEQRRVAANILAIATKYRQVTEIPPLAELAICWQESNWREGATNASDPQGSYGPWQLNGEAWVGAQREGLDPWEDYGYGAIWQQHQSAWASGYAAAWADPSSRPAVLQEFAPAAQGSIPWSQAQAQSAYSNALAMLELLS